MFFTSFSNKFGIRAGWLDGAAGYLPWMFIPCGKKSYEVVTQVKAQDVIKSHDVIRSGLGRVS